VRGKETNIFLYFYTISNSALNGKGPNHTSDCPLQKLNPQVDMTFIPLAITKFTDQSRVAHSANKTPFVWLFMYLNLKAGF
jgi:hypothetical protein